MKREPMALRRTRLRRTFPTDPPEHYDIRKPPLAASSKRKVNAARDRLADRVVARADVVADGHEEHARDGQLLAQCACNDCVGRCPPGEQCALHDVLHGRDQSHASPAENRDEGPDAPTVPVPYVTEPQAALPGELVPYCDCTGYLGRCLPEHCATCPHGERLKRGRDFFALRPR